MELVRGYREKEKLRRSFNALAEETFGLNFEDWYQMGFWGEDYEPWSVLVAGEVVANVSVNRTDLEFGGRRHRLIQLGTVMTKKEHRNKGYLRMLMEQVARAYPEAEGVYLFANDSVVDFYPKFGFRRGREVCYRRSLEQQGDSRIEQVRMEGPEDWARLREAMAQGEPGNDCPMVDNPGLIFFYAAQFLKDCVYHDPRTEAWVIGELEEGILTVHNVFGPAGLDLGQVIAGFGGTVREAVLGFAPRDREGWTAKEWNEEDCTFFVQGEVFREFEALGLRIPSLSHA